MSGSSETPICGRAGPDEVSLESALAGSAVSAEAWDPARFRHVAEIQVALPNSGCIELWEDLLLGGLVAVKVMPVSWTCSSHEEFLNTYEHEREMPWRDICVTYYLGRTLGPGNTCEFIGLFRRFATPAAGKLVRDAEFSGYQATLEQAEEEEVQYCLVLSYCAGGDCFTWLQRSLTVTGGDRESAARSLTRRVVQIMSLVHQAGIAHGDLSLENVLLVGQEEIDPPTSQLRLVDFGAATGAVASGARGKPSYQAPEMHLDGEYDAFAADVFSLGVMIFTLVVGNYPWTSTRPGICQYFRYAVQQGFPAYLVRRKVRAKDGTVKPLSQVLSPVLSSLLSVMLTPRPAERLSLAAVQEHSWLRL
eukprot:TRINITY_DN91781_c0_g1_i1.p1 TRINITY_DN91781_c0_g1~~TRINITY_DN91781_c0_g1_i1.p1  ORF type:complete len:363 (+),score=48.56 TRINITY_DN91781_c0_g1_i1:2-1090(+)